MGILGPIIFVVFFLFVIIILGFSIILNGILGLWYGFIRRFFGGSPMASGGCRQRYWRGRSPKSERQAGEDGKIFSSDEGTYVDFEEVK